jgi:hypothetical protein
MGIINFGVWVVVVLYMLYVIGYTYQFIEYYAKDFSVSPKNTLKLVTLTLMFFLLPFIMGVFLYNITVENL